MQPESTCGNVEDLTCTICKENHPTTAQTPRTIPKPNMYHPQMRTRPSSHQHKSFVSKHIPWGNTNIYLIYYTWADISYISGCIYISVYIIHDVHNMMLIYNMCDVISQIVMIYLRRHAAARVRPAGLRQLIRRYFVLSKRPVQ